MTLRGGGVDEGVELEDSNAEEEGIGSTDDDDSNEGIELEDSDTEEKEALLLPSRKRKRHPHAPHPGRAYKRTTAAMMEILASAARFHTRFAKIMFLRRWLECSADCLASGCNPTLGAEEQGKRAGVPLLRWKLEELELGPRRRW